MCATWFAPSDEASQRRKPPNVLRSLFPKPVGSRPRGGKFRTGVPGCWPREIAGFGDRSHALIRTTREPPSAAWRAGGAAHSRTVNDEARDPQFPLEVRGLRKSGRQDLNLRPLGPEAASPMVDGVGPSGTGADPLAISGAASGPLPDGVARNGPDRTESWAPVGQAPRLLGVERLLTVREVAALLGVSRATVCSAAEKRTLPHIRIGMLIRFRREDVMASRIGAGATLIQVP
jgi:excisionase family DNA binding protein